MFVRKSLETIDVLDCDNEDLRRGFAHSASSIGVLQTSNEKLTAHILYLRPLMIGTVTTEDQGQFLAESPGYYQKSVSCTRVSKKLDNDYTIMQCENLDGASFNLNHTYPKLSQEKNEDKYYLGYSEIHKQKILTKNPDENSLKGAIMTDVGTDKIYGIKGKDRIIEVDELHKTYDDII